MNDKWIDYAIRIQSIAQAGLQYGKDKFDIERYEELRKISAEMISAPDNLATDKSTREQIRMCFESSKTPDSPTIFE